MRSPRLSIATATMALASLGFVGVAFGHRIGLNLTEEQKTCLTTCRESQDDCVFDAREAMKACLEESGCDALRATYRETCLVETPDATACAAARDAFRACVEPCRETSHTAEKSCRDAVAECATTTCGITLPTPPPRPSGTPSGTPPSGTPGPGDHGPRPPRGPGMGHGGMGHGGRRF